LCYGLIGIDCDGNEEFALIELCWHVFASAADVLLLLGLRIRACVHLLVLWRPAISGHRVVSLKSVDTRKSA
jgi:hypothetical protein